MQKMSQLVIGTSVLVGALLGLSGTAHASVQQDFINQNKTAVQQVTRSMGCMRQCKWPKPLWKVDGVKAN